MKKTHKIFGFTALAIAMFMGTLDTTIINIALPDITDYFKASLNDTSWISTIYVLSLSVCMITASKIADQFGRKKVMIIGLILFGGSSALCGLSSSLMFLIVMRGIQGIGGAIITPLVIPMALATFGKEKTAVLAGAIGAITALAAAGGPPIGGLLVEYVNWQAIFYINIPFAFIAIILAIFFQKESYDQTASKSIDWAGIILLSTTLFLLTFALLKGNDYGWSSMLIVSMFIGSAVSLILFIFTELKVKAPMMELPLFREITFTTSTICYLITGFGIVVPGLIFNYFLQNVIGYSPLHAAIIVTPLSLTVIISMPLGSLISKKMDARIVNFMGIFGMGVSAFTLSRLTINASEALMTGEMVLFGFALGFSVQALVSSIKYIPEEKSGMGSGIVNDARQIGTCIGIAILVSLLTTYVTDAKNDIKSSALEDINNHKDIAEPVRKIIVDSINKNMKNSDDMQQNDIKASLEKDIKNALKKLSAVTKPEKTGKIKDGSEKLIHGVGLAGQQYEIKSIMDKLSSNKDEKVTGAFNKTFLIGAIILMLVSVCGFFTDKSEKVLSKSDRIL
ncbi:MAG TPA: MFS transporter [Clostridia bacterium]|nr:MFS transporter [Clostridia bacterium]